MKQFQMTVFLAMVVFGMPLLPALAQNAGQPPTAPPPTSMGGMAMGGMMMMEKCQKDCDVMSATMADMVKTIAAARASNDVAALHAALDQIQASLETMDAPQKGCKAMMDHMHQMMMPMPGAAAH